MRVGPAVARFEDVVAVATEYVGAIAAANFGIGTISSRRAAAPSRLSTATPFLRVRIQAGVECRLRVAWPRNHGSMSP